MVWFLVAAYLALGLCCVLMDVFSISIHITRNPHSVIVNNGVQRGLAYTTFIVLATWIMCPIVLFCAYIRAKVTKWRNNDVR